MCFMSSIRDSAINLISVFFQMKFEFSFYINIGLVFTSSLFVHQNTYTLSLASIEVRAETSFCVPLLYSSSRQLRIHTTKVKSYNRDL